MLPSRDPPSLLLRVSGSANMTIESSSGVEERAGGTALVGRMLERTDDFLLVALLASALALSASGLAKELSMPIKFVGRLGVHLAKPLGEGCRSPAAGVSAVASAIAQKFPK